MDAKEEFMAALYQNNYKRLENYCLCYVNYDVQYRDLIDECLQEVMLQAASDYDEIYEYSTSHLSAWLMNTCQNRFSTALRKYRRRFKRHAYSLDDNAYYESFAISSDNIQEFLEQLMKCEDADRILSALNNRERRIADMRFRKNMSYKDIAKQEHSTIGAVKAVIARVVAKGRKIIKKDFDFIFIFIVSFCFVARLI